MANTSGKSGSNDEQTPAQAAAEALKSAESSEDAESYPVEYLIENPSLVGQPGFVLAGAVSGTNRKNLTIDEARAACDTWLKAKVKTDQPQEA
jgi:hypothetical protein